MQSVPQTVVKFAASGCAQKCARKSVAPVARITIAIDGKFKNKFLRQFEMRHVMRHLTSHNLPPSDCNSNFSLEKILVTRHLFTSLFWVTIISISSVFVTFSSVYFRPVFQPRRRRPARRQRRRQRPGQQTKKIKITRTTPNTKVFTIFT